MDWFHDILVPLLLTVTGSLLTLIGIWITFCHDNKIRKKESIDKAKPILINIPFEHVKEESEIITLYFESDEGEHPKDLRGIFKNTDNGILFIDNIKTETKEYLSGKSEAVDKNTVFQIILKNIVGEKLTECKMYCHDIFNNKYYYDIEFRIDKPGYCNLYVRDTMPNRVTRSKKKKGE